jgi:two-component system, chemotaxis family, chemotaxis protein CheY
MTPRDVSVLKFLHILIVDDDETMRSLLKKMVRRLGAETTEAENAEAALAKLQTSQPPINFVLCDWNMPGLSGLDFFNCLKAVGPEVPLIMITGRDDLDSVLKARQAGVSAYIVKPVTPQELASKISLLASKVGHPFARAV